MTDSASFASVLERLLCALVDKPRMITLDASPLQGRVNFLFGCEINDIGLIVAKRGVRLRALRLIVEIAGRNVCEDWRLDQPNDLPGERRIGRNTQREIPEFHNPAADFELLRDLLNALAVNVTLSVSGDVKHGFTFLALPAQVQDNVALLDAHQAVYSASQNETQAINLISALGQIWRAIGARQGVRYEVTSTGRTPLA